MRILQVSSASSLGGGELHVIGLCQALLDRGHDLHVALRPKSSLDDYLSPLSLTVHRLPLRNSLDVVSAHRLSRIMQHDRIDILHGHVARDYPVCALAQRLSGRGRLILTRHHYLPIKSHWLSRRLIGGAAKIIAVSESVRRGLIDSLDLLPAQVVVIPNWIDPDPYRMMPDRQQTRRQFGLKQRFVVGMVGQIAPPKGVEEFIRAAALVSAIREDVLFLIAGDEPDPRQRFTHRMRQLAHDLALGSRLRFMGRIEDLISLLAALDVFVLPSWQEAFGIVLIEAMAASLAVIASDIGGPAEIVTSGVTGLLTPPRHVDSLAQAINQLLNDPRLRERFGKMARQAVETRFEREMVIDQIESVYQRSEANM